MQKYDERSLALRHIVHAYAIGDYIAVAPCFYGRYHYSILFKMGEFQGQPQRRVRIYPARGAPTYQVQAACMPQRKGV